jgi:hypothetical protein
MAHVTELRVALTVADFDEAVASTATPSDSNSWPTGVATTAASSSSRRGRATLELFDQAQAERVDAIEVGHRVSVALGPGVDGRPMIGRWDFG